MCRSRRELSNEYLLAKIGVDTAENEPLEVWGEISIQYSFASLAAPVPLALLLNLLVEDVGWNAIRHSCVRGSKGRLPAAEAEPEKSVIFRKCVVRKCIFRKCIFRKFCKFLAGSFSAVSKRNFARKYTLESSRRDLHNALLCTVH